jgi:hypothetical protein
MKITIESTSRIVEIKQADGAWVPARVWEGQTSSGIPVVCCVTRVAVRNGQPTEQFEAELRECRPPSEDSVQPAIPLRMII